VPAKGPLVLRALRRYPILQGVPARLVGLGILPEHVRSPTASGASPPALDAPSQMTRRQPWTSG
jgi:hypothetical protein